MTTQPQAPLTVSGLPALVPQLHHGDVIHLAPHEVFQHTKDIHHVACREADVEVDCLLPVGAVIVICWILHLDEHADAHGATVYDADDSVERKVVAAA